MSNTSAENNATTAKLRYWLLTIHNPASWTPPNTLNSGGWESVQWVRGQQEIGSNTGTEHWQVFVAFKRPQRLSAIKKLFGRRVHAQPSRSEAAEEYVWKNDTAVDGTQFELGAKAFKRNSKIDWNAQKQLAIQGKLEDVDPSIFIQYYSTLKRIASDFAPAPLDLPNVTGIWIYGPPGTGKSHFARANYSNGGLYLKNQNKWWCGYQGESNVLIDDYDSDKLGHLLKIWADKFAFRAEYKGGSMQIRPKHIIITSNYKIQDLFIDTVLAEALQRRFYNIHIPLRMF